MDGSLECVMDNIRASYTTPAALLEGCCTDRSREEVHRRSTDKFVGWLVA